MKYFLAFGIFLATTLSWAGPRVNNGGGVWTCRNQDDKATLRWARTHDLLDLHFRYQADDPGLRDFGTATAWQIYRSLIQEISEKYPPLQQLLKKHPLALAHKMTLKNVRIDVIQDAKIYFRPPRISCPGGSLQYEQGADFLMDNTLLIDRDLWTSSALGQADKAALLMHELIYYVARAEYLDQTSLRAQRIVEILFGDQSDSVKRSLMVEVLSPDFYAGEREASEVALYNVELTCRALTIDTYAEVVLEHQVLTWLKEGETYQSSLGQYKFIVNVNTLDGLPETMKIINEELGAEVESDLGSLRSSFLQKRRYSITLKNRKTLQSALFECWSK